ncbi:MAG TPA: hypothetical protein P5048_01535 [Chlamydiales bacterium]|nr:hypothetical protein [Chlamydiales bacterium]
MKAPTQPITSRFSDSILRQTWKGSFCHTILKTQPFPGSPEQQQTIIQRMTIIAEQFFTQEQVHTSKATNLFELFSCLNHYAWSFLFLPRDSQKIQDSMKLIYNAFLSITSIEKSDENIYYCIESSAQ